MDDPRDFWTHVAHLPMRGFVGVAGQDLVQTDPGNRSRDHEPQTPWAAATLNLALGNTYNRSNYWRSLLDDLE